MKKILLALLFLSNIIGITLAYFEKLSKNEVWIVTGLYIITVIILIIGGEKIFKSIFRINQNQKGDQMKATLLSIFALLFLFFLQSSKTSAQSFEELNILSKQNVSILQELKSGTYGPLKIYEDEGSMGGWIKVEAFGFYFSSAKENVVGVQGIKTTSPTILGGELNKDQYILLIRTYEPGFISGENELYLIDNNSYTKLFIPGYVDKVFEEKGLIVIDSQVGGYQSPTYTQFYSVVSTTGETILYSTYQKKVESEIMK
ncbi:hypothetical protein IPN41_00815 [Candidatus Falkowbacteria bacterium]|nr:MAG: hypothetical protein IPN41_00815 [Candidatus Falkowbacteria bacterium]